MAEIKVKVRDIRQEALEVKAFDLAPIAGVLPPFTPGSHIDVRGTSGVVRQYSLVNGPNESIYRIAVKLEPASRGGSSAMHGALQVGDELTISEPRNNFRLHEGADHNVLIAGGIGITPLLSMLQHLDSRHESFELQYFSRSVAHTPFHGMLSKREWADKVGFHHALDPAAVTAYMRKHLWHRQDGAHLYLCGPRPFMDLVEQTAAITWPPETVHTEYFSADPASLAGPREVFVVRCARSGGDYTIPANDTIVDALRKHDIKIETSCEQGVCGTCLTGVLQGEPDHRDVYLTDDEKRSNDKMMPCVSRARSDILVLDL